MVASGDGVAAVETGVNRSGLVVGDPVLVDGSAPIETSRSTASGLPHAARATLAADAMPYFTAVRRVTSAWRDEAYDVARPRFHGNRIR